MSDQNEKLNNDIEVSQFGLTESFVETLDADDFRGVLNAIAKYAAQSRHPDKTESRLVSYEFGVSDSRTLTALAGAMNQMPIEEVEDLRASYSEQATTSALMEELKLYQTLYSQTLEENTRLKTSTIEFMLPSTDNTESEQLLDKNRLTFSDIRSGSYYFTSRKESSHLNFKPVLLSIDFNTGGKINSVTEMESIDANYIEKSEDWIQDILKESEIIDNLDLSNKGTEILIEKIGNKINLIIKLEDGTFSQIKKELSIKSKSTKKEVYRIFYPLNKKTEIPEPSENLVCVKYGQKKINIIDSDSYLIGFGETKSLNEIERTYTSEVPETELPRVLGRVRDENVSVTRNDYIKKINLDNFWKYIEKSKEFTKNQNEATDFNREITNKSSETIAFIYELKDLEVDYTGIESETIKPQQVLCPNTLFDEKFLGISYII
jgi:hypothetical protein